MAIAGLRDTNNFVTDQRPKDWREGIMLNEPNGNVPLFALTSLMKTKVATDPEFNWWEKTLNAQRAALTANLATTDTSIDFGTDGAKNAGFKNGHILEVEENGELVRVTAATDDTITIVRAVASTTEVLVDFDGDGINPYLRVVGNAHEEGSARPTGINFDPTKRTNYTQIFRDNLEMTETAAATNLRTGDQVREAKREALQYHSVAIEKALWLGKGVETTLNGRPWRLTWGFIHWITNKLAANVVTAAAAVDLEEFEDWMEQAFRFGSSEKMGFCGNRALLVLQRIARLNASYELVQGQKEFGMNVTRIVSPFGELVLKRHPLWNQFITDVNPTTGTTEFTALDSTLAIVDMAELTYRPLKTRDTFFKGGQEDRGDDAMISGYITEAGLQINHPENHFVIKNLSSGKLDG